MYLQKNQRQKTVIGIVLSLLLPLLAVLTSGYLVNRFFMGGYFSRILLWLSLALLYLYAIKVEKQPFLLWKEKKQSFLHYFLGVICVYFSAMLCTIIVSKILSLAHLVQKSDKLGELLAYMQSHKILLVFTCLTAGIMEELVFRGYLMPRLEALFKSKPLAIIISALMFGALHFGYGTIINVVGPIIIGLIFGIYYQKFGNLKVLMICHFLIDVLALSFQKP